MPIDEEKEVGPGRIQENEKISNTLISSIYAGHLMFSVKKTEDVIAEFVDRIKHISHENTPVTATEP